MNQDWKTRGTTTRWRLSGEKTKEKIFVINERKKKNREDDKKLFGQLISIGDGYFIIFPLKGAEIEWKNLEDPFGNNNNRFEWEGKLISTENESADQRVSLEMLAEKRVQEKSEMT